MQQRTPAAYRTMSPGMRFDLPTAAQLSMVLIGIIAAGIVCHLAQTFLAPVTAAFVIGLMFGPVAARAERVGLPAAVSAAFTVLAFLLLIALSVAILSVPMSAWLERLPQMWQKIQSQLAHWQNVIVAIEAIRTEVQSAFDNSNHMVVTVDNGDGLQAAAGFAPVVAGQIALFLVSMYLFLANRVAIRNAILSLCLDRRLRWRAAHVFRGVEQNVSRYLLSITLINICLGVVVGVTFWLAGIPSPLLWGLLAALSNYVAFIGQGFMLILLVGEGLSRGTTLFEILLPAGLFSCLAFVESQLVTPGVVGRAVTINPFAVFLCVTFGIWIWGPIGGFVAVPMLILWKTTFDTLTAKSTT